MIEKILKVEKDQKDDEEEILSDDEFELDSDDDTKKRKVKKSHSKPVGEVVNESKVEFNEDEEEIEATEDREADNEEGDEDNEGDGDNDEDDCNMDEEGDEEDSDSEDDDDELAETVEKKSLKRIVVMEEDSDDEAEKKEEDHQPLDVNQSENAVEDPSEAAPLLDGFIPTEPLNNFDFSATQNDNELFDLCSGKFTTQLPMVDDCSQVVQEASQVKDFQFATATPMDEDNTQGVDKETKEEEEITTNKAQEEVEVNAEEATVAGPHGKAAFLSSSDEEGAKDEQKEGDSLKVKKLKKKKRKQRIVIDEDEDDDLPAAPALDDDSEGEEEEEEDDDEEPPQIEELEEYKSFLTAGQSHHPEKKKRMRATDFIEKEAELSDSEWGSEDEDERGLDAIEDIGLVKDDDNFDGEQLRDEVGRIHMRQMANEDNRELKYLKDMILNEEEMDGQGRQRTFKWQNINGEEANDFNANGGVATGQEGENCEAGAGSDDDEENEANWRKQRLDMEKTLLENKSTVKAIQTRFDAVMKQTREIRVVKPKGSGAASGDGVLKENSSPSFLMQDESKKYMNLRQSFLLRDEETLNRLATISAKADGVTANDGKGNFVFRRLEDKVSYLLFIRSLILD